MSEEDFWFDEIKYPNDFEGNPAYAPINPGHPSWQRLTRWADMGKHGDILRGMAPQWIWMHPATNWKVWHLSGPREGLEGAVLAQGLDADELDFEQRYSEGPYLIGAELERTDYKKGVFQFGIWINPNANPLRPAGGPFAMHKIEDSWRQSWSDTVPGFLGCFTRTHGWRFIPCIKGEKIKRDGTRSPTAHGNQSLLLNMTAHAPWPLFAKRAIVKPWKATADDVDAHGVATHTFAIPNRGTFETCPKYVIRGQGDVTIQNGIEGRQVPIPSLERNDGSYMLVDTDESRQTITTELQPIDNQLYKTLRSSQFLQLLLHDELNATLPAQRRIPGGIDFDNPIPARTVAHLKVTHSNPAGSIEIIMPQMFRASWA